MKSYKQLNRVMGDIRDAVHHAYDIGYDEGKKYSSEKIKFLENARTTTIIPELSSIGFRFKCQKCHETMVAQYPFCPWCGRIDGGLLK